jgi:hypothetical protein
MLQHIYDHLKLLENKKLNNKKWDQIKNLYHYQGILSKGPQHRREGLGEVKDGRRYQVKC